jgi:hypothetical protein
VANPGARTEIVWSTAGGRAELRVQELKKIELPRFLSWLIADTHLVVWTVYGKES